MIRAPMPKSPLLVDRLLKTPHLEKIVPHLQPEVLHRVIQACTLEDCADLIAMATPAQISRVSIWISGACADAAPTNNSMPAVSGRGWKC